MFELQNLVRPNIWALKPYCCARDEFKGREAHVFLDANECPYGEWNRYPDPLQEELKAVLSPIKGVPVGNIFLGNGSDEAIDIIYRIFCRPGIDNVVAISPTYGMYQVCADVNDIDYRPVALDQNFQLSAQKVLDACDSRTKVIWICSPNNPTGNDMDRRELQHVLQEFKGIVVVDEAYGDFSTLTPIRNYLNMFPNMIVLNTFSKAWGSAAIRLGMAFASEEIIALFNKVKYPYNVNSVTQHEALQLLLDKSKLERWMAAILSEREHVIPSLMDIPCVKKVYPTAANFVLVKVTDADKIYNYLVDRGIVVRNRNRVQLCSDCLRITIGTREENSEVIGALRQFVN